MTQKASSATFQTLIGNLAVVGAAGINAIVVTRMIGPVGRGYLTTLIAWSAVVGTLCGFGFPTAFVYFSRRRPATYFYLYRRLRILLTGSSVLAALAGVALSFYLGSVGPVDSTTQAVTLAASCVLFFVEMTLLTSSQSLDTFRFFNVARALSGAVYCGLAVVLLAALGREPQLAAVALLVGRVASSGYLLAAFAANPPKSAAAFASAPEKDVPLASYAVRTMGTESLGILNTYIDKLILVGLVPPRTLGAYAAGFGLSRVLTQVLGPLATVAFPRAAGLPEDEAIAVILKTFRGLSIVILLIIVAVLVMGRPAFLLVFGEEFVAGASSFVVLSIEAALTSGGQLLAQAFNAIGRPGATLLRQALGFGVTVALIFALWPSLGMVGIATAVLGGTLARLILTISILTQSCGVRPRQFLFGTEDFRWMGLALGQFLHSRLGFRPRR